MCGLMHVRSLSGDAQPSGPRVSALRAAPRLAPRKVDKSIGIAASGCCGVVGSTDAPSYCVKEVNSKLYRTSVGSVSK